MLKQINNFRGIVQLEEHRVLVPAVVGSSPTPPAKENYDQNKRTNKWYWWYKKI